MKSKVITMEYSEDPHDCFHYRVEEWKGKKVLLGWPGTDSESDCKYDITDISDMSVYEFDRLYMRLAVHGHLLDLERTIQEQTPIFADNSWKIAMAIGKTDLVEII
tara:strand:+ start:806 stop:1123 length:318 start_codon:yes stop_codon:yes gene_type:complete